MTTIYKKHLKILKLISESSFQQLISKSKKNELTIIELNNQINDLKKLVTTIIKKWNLNILTINRPTRYDLFDKGVWVYVKSCVEQH